MDLNSYASLNLSLTNDGRVLVLELDHGKANEMGSEQLREFEQLCETLESQSVIRGLVSYSSKRSKRGTPIFIAGANVNERIGWDDARVKSHVVWQREVLNRFRQLPIFTVAVVEGVALGWGTEFLLVCDYRICTTGAGFALPETGLGILPGAGGTSDLWAHIGVSQTLRLGMTGEKIGGLEAKTIGLVQECFDDAQTAFERACKLAELAARKSPTAMASFKRGVLSSVGRDPHERLGIEAQAYAECVDHGDAAIGREHFTAIRNGEEVPWPSR